MIKAIIIVTSIVILIWMIALDWLSRVVKKRISNEVARNKMYHRLTDLMISIIKPFLLVAVLLVALSLPFKSSSGSPVLINVERWARIITGIGGIAVALYLAQKSFRLLNKLLREVREVEK